MTGNSLLPRITVAQALNALCLQIYDLLSSAKGKITHEDINELPHLVFHSAVEFLGFLFEPVELDDLDSQSLIELRIWYVDKLYRDEFMAIIAQTLDALQPADFTKERPSQNADGSDEALKRNPPRTPKDFTDRWKEQTDMTIQ